MAAEGPAADPGRAAQSVDDAAEGGHRQHHRDRVELLVPGPPTSVRVREAVRQRGQRDRQQQDEHEPPGQELSTRPEIVGPIAGATEISTLMLPITRTAAGPATGRARLSSAAGSSPRRRRLGRRAPSSSSQKPGEIAANRAPAENRPMARPKTVRVDSRCSRKPAVGMTMAIVSMNAVVSHRPVRGGDREVRHQPGQGDAHDRLVEDDPEGRDQQGADDPRDWTGRTSVGAPARDAGDDECSDLRLDDSWWNLGVEPEDQTRSPGELIAPRRDNLTRSRYEGRLTSATGFRRKVNRVRDPRPRGNLELERWSGDRRHPEAHAAAGARRPPASPARWPQAARTLVDPERHT